MEQIVRSHIQMPKMILKNFHNANNELFYYDYKTQKISKGHAKTLYREEGYYSKKVEDFLGNKIENPLKKLISFLQNTNFEDGDTPPVGYEELAFNYIYSLLSRAPSTVREINRNSVFFQLLTETDRHDIAAHDALIVAKERKLLKEFNVFFLSNTSSEPLVLPTGGIIQCGERLICPVTPWRAIVFDKCAMPKEEEKTIIRLYEVTSIDTIKALNILAFKHESKHDRKYLVASSRQQLEKIVDAVQQSV